ncbi:MAG: hypothetical protein ACREPM_21425, partial [Gemmatimonadaceae bacterium]
SYSARVPLGRGTVFAQFVVASADGKRVDDNDARGWEAPMTDSASRPLYEGLWIERAIDARVNWERGASVAHDMARYYPLNPGAIRFAMAVDVALAGSAGSDSVVGEWRPRIHALQHALASAALDAGSMSEFAMLAAAANDTSIARFWRERMIREYPNDPATIQQRVFAVFETSRGGRGAALAQLERLYDETGGQSPQLLTNAFDLAAQANDSASIARWGDRLVAFGGGFEANVSSTYAALPGFRDRAMILLRSSLASLPAIRPAADWRVSLRQQTDGSDLVRGQWQLVALGKALLDTRRTDAARDTLRRAVALSWDPRAMRLLGDAELAATDTNAALAAYAWASADSRTTAVQADSLRRRVVGPTRAGAWDEALADGRSTIDAITLRRAITRSFDPSIVYATAAGRRLSIAEGIGAAPTAVIAFISRYCAPSLADLRSLDSLRVELAPAGIPVLATIEESADVATQHAIERLGYHGALAFDDRGVVSRSMRSFGTPEYFVVENGRTIRFMSRRAEEVKPFVNAVSRTR